MRLATVACAVLTCASGAAWAVPPLDATLASTLVSGPTAPSASSETLTGPVDSSGVFNPSLRVGLSAVLAPQLGERGDLRISWGLWRDQALCDTCGDGEGPGWLGRELLGSTDLSVATGRRFDVGDGRLRLAAEAVLPASRDALVCNPMVGAPGASASLSMPAGHSAVATSVRASRPIYLHSAAPVGACAPPLKGAVTTDTLTGAATPEPWDSTRSARANPTFLGSGSVSWLDPHALLAHAPERLSTGLSVGLSAQRNPVDPAVTVDTLSGTATLEASARPVTASIPWSLSAGWSASDHLDLQLQLANQLPTWLADPGGALRALPARTALTVSATGHL